MIKASIIIITRNRQEFLNRCLDSLAAYRKPGYEIIVIDDCSRDETEKTVKKFQGVIYFRNKKNLGVAASRNRGIVKARGKFIIFLDDDVVLKNNTSFDKIMEFMDENREIGIVGPKIVYPDNRIQESARCFPTPLALLWRGTFLNKIFPNVSFYQNYIFSNIDSKTPKEVDWVMGACQIISKSVFEKIGLFDEKFFLVYDDIDICFRIKKAGLKIMYYPSVEITHHYQRTSAKKFINKAKLSHLKSILRFFRKSYFGKDR